MHTQLLPECEHVYLKPKEMNKNVTNAVRTCLHDLEECDLEECDLNKSRQVCL